MAINIDDPEADALTRTFARMAGLSISEAIVTVMKEAIDRRRNREEPLETARRLREKHGVVIGGAASKPLQREICDEMWDE
jgi:antitoxin VapB